MGKSITDTFAVLQQELSGTSIPDTLHALAKAFPGAVTFSTSFSYEDQVVTDLIAKTGQDISLFTLDTGRLFPETYSTWSRTVDQYGLKIKAFYPQASLLEPFIEENGPNAFYASVENRKQCCNIRKVEPLKRALQNNSVWITGLRAEHSPARKDLTVFEWDETNQVIKYNPLLHWTTEEVISYIKKYAVPFNVLHEKGFVSIGCAPCTRAIKPGEDFRAGRWWWEDSSKKECGLHVHEAVSK
ncbi:MAG: phosphoadenylyl-sulfate reductase [Flavisolibacter sp.]